MYKKWEDIKKEYPNQWVYLVNYKHRDRDGQILDGGEVVAYGVTKEDMYEMSGFREGSAAIHHTREEEDDGGSLFSYKYKK